MLSEIIQTVKDNAYTQKLLKKKKKQKNKNRQCEIHGNRLELWFPGAGGMNEMC